MITLNKARKILGKEIQLTDEELLKELELTEFIASLVIEIYKRPNYYFKEESKNGLQS